MAVKKHRKTRGEVRADRRRPAVQIQIAGDMDQWLAEVRRSARREFLRAQTGGPRG